MDRIEPSHQLIVECFAHRGVGLVEDPEGELVGCLLEHTRQISLHLRIVVSACEARQLLGPFVLHEGP